MKKNSEADSVWIKTHGESEEFPKNGISNAVHMKTRHRANKTNDRAIAPKAHLESLAAHSQAN